MNHFTWYTISWHVNKFFAEVVSELPRSHPWKAAQGARLVQLERCGPWERWAPEPCPAAGQGAQHLCQSPSHVMHPHCPLSKLVQQTKLLWSNLEITSYFIFLITRSPENVSLFLFFLFFLNGEQMGRKRRKRGINWTNAQYSVLHQV